MKPILYLIPTPLGVPDTPCLLPHEQQAIVGLMDFVVEAEKTARAHLKHLGVTTPIHELNLQTLNEHTDLKTLPELLKPLQEGRSMGIVSEAGCRLWPIRARIWWHWRINTVLKYGLWSGRPVCCWR